jgi:hypothetical protein
MRQSFFYTIAIIASLTSCKNGSRVNDIDSAKMIVAAMKSDTTVKQVLLTHYEVDSGAFAAFLSGYYKGNELHHIDKFCDYPDSMVVKKYYFDKNELLYSYNVSYKLAQIIPSLPKQKNYDTLSEFEYYLVDGKPITTNRSSEPSKVDLQRQYLYDSSECVNYASRLRVKRKNGG